MMRSVLLGIDSQWRVASTSGSMYTCIQTSVFCNSSRLRETVRQSLSSSRMMSQMCRNMLVFAGLASIQQQKYHSASMFASSFAFSAHQIQGPPLTGSQHLLHREFIRPEARPFLGIDETHDRPAGLTHTKQFRDPSLIRR